MGTIADRIALVRDALARGIVSLGQMARAESGDATKALFGDGSFKTPGAGGSSTKASLITATGAFTFTPLASSTVFDVYILAAGGGGQGSDGNAGATPGGGGGSNRFLLRKSDFGASVSGSVGAGGAGGIGGLAPGGNGGDTTFGLLTVYGGHGGRINGIDGEGGDLLGTGIGGFTENSFESYNPGLQPPVSPWAGAGHAGFPTANSWWAGPAGGDGGDSFGDPNSAGGSSIGAAGGSAGTALVPDGGNGGTPVLPYFPGGGGGGGWAFANATTGGNGGNGTNGGGGGGGGYSASGTQGNGGSGGNGLIYIVEW